MVAAQHHRSDFAGAHHRVELQGDPSAAGRILVQDAGLGAHHQPVLLGVADPDPVVAVLPAPVRIDGLHGRPVGCGQVFGPSAEAHPAEGSVAVVEQHGSHDVLDVGGEDESLAGIDAVAADLPDAGVVDRPHERIAVVEKVGAPLHQGADELEVAPQAPVHGGAEGGAVLRQHQRPLLEGQPLGAVPAVIRGVAGGLVRQQLDGHPSLHRVFEQVHHVPLVGDGERLAAGHGRLGQAEHLAQVGAHRRHPALLVPRADARRVHLGDDADAAGDLHRLGLGAAHAAESRRNEQMAAQVLVVADPQPEPGGVQDGVERAVHDPLRADVHPAAGGHLAVVGHAELHGPVPLGLVVEHAHHERVGDDHPRRLGARGEEAQRVSRLHHQRLLPGEHLQVALDEAVLHPILADLAGLAVGHQLVRVEGHIEVQVVVDHHLEGLPLEAASLVLVDGSPPDPARGAEAVAVDAAARLQLVEELRGQRRMPLGRHVAERVLQGEDGFAPVQGVSAVGRAADARFERGRRRQLAAQADGHGGADGGVVGHGGCLPVR